MYVLCNAQEENAVLALADFSSAIDLDSQCAESYERRAEVHSCIIKFNKNESTLVILTTYLNICYLKPHFECKSYDIIDFIATGTSRRSPGGYQHSNKDKTNCSCLLSEGDDTIC